MAKLRCEATSCKHNSKDIGDRGFGVCQSKDKVYFKTFGGNTTMECSNRERKDETDRVITSFGNNTAASYSAFTRPEQHYSYNDLMQIYPRLITPQVVTPAINTGSEPCDTTEGSDDNGET